MDIDDWIRADGELSDAGLDVAIQISNAEIEMPENIPENVRALLVEAVDAMAFPFAP